MSGFNISKILVPLDGSQIAFDGLDKASYLAKLSGAKITGLYVTFLPPKLSFESINSLDSATRKNIDQIFLKAKSITQKSEVDFQGEIIFGSPGMKILDFAYRWNFDLIVIGSRGAGSKDELVIGSVANEVLHNSKIPVLVIK